MSVTILSFKPTILGTHDFSACLVKNGVILSAIEEERLTRKKHATREFPKNSIHYCLNSQGIGIEEIDVIGIPYDPDLYLRALPFFYNSVFKSEGLINKANNLKSSVKKLTFRLWGRKWIWDILDPHSELRRKPRIQFISHHLSHAASAYYCSGYDDATILTIDGLGEYDSTVIWKGVSGNIRRLKTYTSTNSLGYLYSLFTEYLGFSKYDGEGKVMGLAPYGKFNSHISKVLSKYLIVDEMSYDISGFIKGFGNLRKLQALLGIPIRERNMPVTQVYKDIAWYIQDFTEKAVISVVKDGIRLTNLSKVCLAGGVALNCIVNKKISELEIVDGVFIQPAANDSGLAVGCAQVLSRNYGYSPMHEMHHPYLGPEYEDSYIEDLLQRNGVEYSVLPDVPSVIARELVEGNLVGWFQGRMELGPRALGNRSILADPRHIGIKDKLNTFVKNREYWRPFAPSVLIEHAKDWFAECKESSFMIMAYNSTLPNALKIPGVVHPADYTSRVHTVDPNYNFQYYQLINEFYKITNIPMLLNTSFNIAGEPIVCSPEDAISTFERSGLDILVLNNFRINKQKHA